MAALIAAIAAIIVALINKDYFSADAALSKSQRTESPSKILSPPITPSPKPASTPGPGERQLYVRNACGHPIRLAIQFRQGDDTWMNSGWQVFDAHSDRTLTNENGMPVMLPRSTNVYVEKMDGTPVVQGTRIFRLGDRDVAAEETVFKSDRSEFVYNICAE